MSCTEYGYYPSTTTDWSPSPYYPMPYQHPPPHYPQPGTMHPSDWPSEAATATVQPAAAAPMGYQQQQPQTGDMPKWMQTKRTVKPPGGSCIFPFLFSDRKLSTSYRVAPIPVRVT